MIDQVELLTVGRISVDLYAEQVSIDWEAVRSFAKAVGGSATNVAIAGARLRRRTALLTRVGDDPPGAYLVSALNDFGVDTSLVGVDTSLPMPLALAVHENPDEPTLLLYGEPSAPDPQLNGDELDHRPQLWVEEEAGEQMRAALPMVTVAIGNLTECRVATGATSPHDAADRLLKHGVGLALLKLAPGGVLAATSRERAMAPPVAVEVVSGLGAGDAFVHGLIEGWDLSAIVRFANAAGAHVAAQLLCSDAMPSPATVYSLLGSKGEAA